MLQPYFGNLINHIKNPYTNEEFERLASRQADRLGDGYNLYIINGWYAVAKVNNNKVVRYTLVDRIDTAKELYTGSRHPLKIKRQVKWQGVSILEGYGIGFNI